MSGELSVTMMNGELRIDRLNGVITFKDGWHRIVLRVTHLREPIPDNVLIDLVALNNLTSYTPLQGESLAQDDTSKAMRAAIQHDLAMIPAEELGPE